MASNGKKLRATGVAVLLLVFCIICAMVFTVVWAVKVSTGGNPSVSTEERGSGFNKQGTGKTGEGKQTTNGGEPQTTAPVVTEPYVVSTATVASTGDILIHTPLLAAADQGDGTYDFSYIFPHIKSVFAKYDYTVANLEVPLGGTEAGKYDGFPRFNAPDSLATALKEAGMDMLLTANNHSSDVGSAALKRTAAAVREAGMDPLGTRTSADEKPYMVKSVNGIPIGMACYTYGVIGDDGRKSLNGNAWITSEVSSLINVFDYDKLSDFYAEAEEIIRGMKQDGAAITVMYIHWGNEYQYKQPNSWQKKIAQKLADLGYDLIIGGHPHVVQPIETLTGVNGNETLCVYSLGNAVSNQRLVVESIRRLEPNGHTEDGMIFTYTVEKWSDGSYRISDVNVLPTWVYMYRVDGTRIYEIVPLDAGAENWTFGEASLSDLKKSFNRTMEIVGKGLNAYRAAHGMTEVVTSVD